MADYNEKSPRRGKHADEIPVPVAALPARTPSVTRVQRALKCILKLAIVAWLVVWVSRWSRTMSERELDAHEGRWVGRVFSQAHTWSPFKVPYGKKAEKLFLCVSFLECLSRLRLLTSASLHVSSTVPNPESAQAASRQYTAKPHMAGTSGDFETATAFLRLLQRELGVHSSHKLPLFDAGSPESRDATLGIPKLARPAAWIDTYYPVMNTPLDHSVEVLDEEGNVAWRAELEEVADDTDPDAGKYYDAITTWHGLSRGGSAQGKLVYANYGRKEDYDALVEQGELPDFEVTPFSSSRKTLLGVDMNGAIIITRYGGIFRGLKVRRLS